MPLLGSRGAASVTGFGGLAKLGYLLRNSLRFRQSNSAYLSRTNSTAGTGGGKTWTYSFWAKIGTLGTFKFFMNAGVTATSDSSVYIDSSDNLKFLDRTGGTLTSTQVFRDPAAWYHIIVAYDSTQATAANRIKMYVNGVQVTSFGTATYPSLNTATSIGNNFIQYIGEQGNQLANYYDGYMTEINFVDGQQLTPSSFGKTDAVTGQWIPIKFGGAYGTNGFYLPFTNKTSTTTLGYDFSPNGNNWTTNNISLTAGSTYDSMTDVPTLTSATAANYCVLNAVNKGANINLTNGNLQYDNVTSDASVFGTIGMSSGKWYWEMTVTSAGCSCGIAAGNLPSSAPGSSATGYAYNYDGRKINNASLSAYGASYTVGDVIGYAFDADAGTITCYKNNTSQGVMFSGLTSGPYFAAAGNGGSGAAYNFGQQGFKYTPPSGFVALNTYNL